MKTHLIVQSIAICLLTMWTSVGGIRVTDAGGPPIRLAVHRNVPDAAEANPAGPHSERTCQLIPTEIGAKKTQFIPTDIGTKTVFAGSVAAEMTSTDLELPLTTGDMSRWSEFEMNTFLNSHLKSSPPVLAELPSCIASANGTGQTIQAIVVPTSGLLSETDLRVTLRPRPATVRSAASHQIR